MVMQDLQALGPVDSAFYFVERDETPMNIGAVAIFEGKIPFQTLVKLIDAKIYQTPLYQKRIIQTPLNLGEPAWAYDPDFYIGKHVFHKVLPAPGTEEQLRQLAGRLISSPLDRSKPLWECHMIEGLENDRTALFFKVHHCMVDGLSAVELITMLFDFTPDPAPLPKKPTFDPPALPTRNELVLSAVGRTVRHKINIFEKIRQDVTSLAEVMVDKEKRRKAFMGAANMISDNLRPLKKLIINGKNTGKQSMAWVEFPMTEIRAIKANHRASVNDVMLTILAGGIERYCRAHSEIVETDALRVIVPVNVRSEAEKGQYGNRISVLTVDVRLNKPSNPLERLEQVTEYTAVMKQSSLTIGLDLVLTLPSLALGPFQPLVWAIAPVAFSVLAHTWCTNVAGPQFPVYLAGHKMLHSYGYFPLNPTMGLATVIMSYNQKITMNLIADQGIIPDVLELAGYLREAFKELKRAAKVPDIDPVVIERPRSVESASSIFALTPEVVPSKGAETLAVHDITDKPAAQPEPAETVVETVVKVESVPTAPPNGNGQGHLVPTPIDTTNATNATNATDSLASVEDKPVETNLAEVPNVPNSPHAANHSNNGSHPAQDGVEVPAASVSQPETASKTASESPAPQAVETASATSPKLVLFSEEWALAFHEAINNNPQYKAASLGWTAGALAFVIKASPKDGWPDAAAVIMDLYKGECRSAHSMPPEQAVKQSEFAIEGDYPTWMRVLSGKDQPLMLLMRGKLSLRKGSMLKLMPYARSAQELVKSAQNITPDD